MKGKKRIAEILAQSGFDPVSRLVELHSELEAGESVVDSDELEKSFIVSQNLKSRELRYKILSNLQGSLQREEESSESSTEEIRYYVPVKRKEIGSDGKVRLIDVDSDYREGE